MNNAVTIRHYRESDKSAVIDVLRDLFASESTHYDRMRAPGEIGAAYVEDLQRESEKSRGAMLVAELDGAVVGYCTLHTHRSSEGDTDEIFYEYAHIGDFVVRSICRGNGIGTQLMQRCEEIVRNAGIKWLRLTVGAANHRGRQFYERAGFNELVLTLEKPLS
ncbi:MAG: GNAT family N-acetyltransferase [Hyphomicrobiales bacterium]